MYIRGKIYGQILFVAEGNIYITGNITNAGVTPIRGPELSHGFKADQPFF